MNMTEPILRVTDLHVEIAVRKVGVQVLGGVSIAIQAGAMQGLVGETGSGKSMTARAIMGLLPSAARITGGRVLLDGRDLLGLEEKQLRRVRGRVIGMIFQNPRTALHPLLSVGVQMENVVATHFSMARKERRERIRHYLEVAGIPDPERVVCAYPHELSGGMAQRVVIATALISEPRILIADEPTTGLDATIQRQILDLLADLQKRLALSILMITHNLGIVAQYCDSVAVMKDGLIVEQGSKRDVLLDPADDYTRKLIATSRLSQVHSEAARNPE